MSFSVEEKSSFIKEFTRSQAINKSKQGGVVYDLVIKKYNELLKTFNSSGKIEKMDNPACLTETVGSLKESIENINEGFDSLTKRLEQVEEKIDSLLRKKPKSKVKLKSGEVKE